MKIIKAIALATSLLSAASGAFGPALAQDAKNSQPNDGPA